MIRIKLRRGTAAEWATANTILALAEPGVETDTGKLKIGDGSTAWTSLPYSSTDWETLEGKPAVIAAGATEADARAAIGAEYTGNKGQTGGYAALDETGRVPLAQVPTGVVIDGVQVSDDAFQLLSGETPVGDPISLLVSNADGGTPYTTSLLRIDGGRLA